MKKDRLKWKLGIVIPLSVLCGWTVLPPKLEVLSKDEFQVTCSEDIKSCRKKAASFCKSETFITLDTSYQVDEKIWKPSKCPAGMMVNEESGGVRTCIANPLQPEIPGAPKGMVAAPSALFLRDSIHGREERAKELKKTFKVRYSCDTAYFKRAEAATEEMLEGDEE